MLLRGLPGVLWRQRLVVVLVVALVALVAGIGVALAPKTYSATATLRVDEPAGAGSVGPVLAGLADSGPVLADAARRLDPTGSATNASAAAWSEAVVGRWDAPADAVVVTAEAAQARTAARRADVVVEVLPLHDPTGGAVFTLGPPSTAPSGFVDPDLRWVVGLAVLAALILAVGAARMRDVRRRTVGGGAEAEDAASAPLLAHVPGPADPADLPSLDPGAADAAVFARLVRALELETSRHRLDRVVVAGVVEGDLPAWLAANLAIAWARTRQVLLVDGRLDPTTGATAPDVPGGPGLHDVLSGAVLDDALIPGPVPGLAVLASGGAGGAGPAHPGSAFVAVMEQAGRRHDVLVVIASPLGVSDDARLMAAGAGLVLVVPEARVTPSELRAHADRVRAAGGRLAGVVLTGAPGRAA